MENKIQLREGINNMVIVGKVKSKEVKSGRSAEGIPTISLNLVVLTEEKLPDNTVRLHENTLRFWAKQTSKLYSSYATAGHEYKTIVEHGEENADVIRATGSFTLNEYTKDGELRSGNSLRAVFVNRVTSPEAAVQEVGAEAECVVIGMADEMKDGLMTGRKKLTLLNVGYESKINEFQNVFVDEKEAAIFAKMYKVGDTAQFTFKINRYAEAKKDANVAPPTTLGFGTGLSNTFGGITDNYINDVIAIGGTAPYIMGVAYSNEQINEMKKLRELSRSELLNSAPAAPLTQQTGFGNPSATFDTALQAPVNATMPMSDGDMPF